MIKKYCINILISVDQLVNTLFGGDPDETISSRLGKYHRNSVLGKIVNALFFWQKSHIVKSIESDEGKDAVRK